MKNLQKIPNEINERKREKKQVEIQTVKKAKKSEDDLISKCVEDNVHQPRQIEIEKSSDSRLEFFSCKA
ncbi:unnamed protein product [Brachionus calyciflorus]|uniref:Uncharacterized protein n=1 Tax=Brachionus calyciflorus TaxID=104777 RepID=A0A814L1D5_9BILA|nr:unnamed protein product [Brachionus calyciflorus]